jgi:succinate dehydrogenase/fumarate reductase flavoprotein subunit
MVIKGGERMGSRVSRRQFLTRASAGVLGGLTAGAAIAATPLASTEVRRWDDEADVVVCGTGAAGFAAAVFAAERGLRVVMLEKAGVIGGTTAKSGGGWWVPNNHLMRKAGRVDPREDAIAYMARCSSPQLYDATLPKLGLRDLDYDLIAAYVDNAHVATEELAQLGALLGTPFRSAGGRELVDYYSHLPENKGILGRCLMPSNEKGEVLNGASLIRQMSDHAKRRNVKVLVEHRAERLVVDAQGRVIGVQARHGDSLRSFGARKGVIFGTGGFTHNPTMADNFLRGPIFGGCAVPTNTGDFVTISSQVGAALGNMNHGWWAEIVLEQALNYASVPGDAFNLGGDSMLVVNRRGHRVYNEKMVYNERTQVHFEWDPPRGEYPNLLTFMIYDERVAQNPGKGAVYPLPMPGFEAPYVITGESLPDLAAKIDARLQSLAGKSAVAGRVSPALRLAPDFAEVLAATVRRFNGFAESGKDLDFQRGTLPIEQAFISYSAPSDKPNKTMYPLASKGPYHCIILAAGTLDTKGGPVIDAQSRVLDATGKVIPGLYGAGNCIASPARQAYWSGGATIGAALTFGYIAAKSAVGNA